MEFCLLTPTWHLSVFTFRKNPELVGHVPKTHTTESDKDSKERCLLAENIKDNSCEENTTHTDLITTVV